MELRFYFDFVCPFAYLASTQVEALAARTSATLVYRPFLLGGVFRALGVSDRLMETLTPQRQAHTLLDRERWAETLAVPLRSPPAHPRRTVLALRAALAAGDALPAASHALFRAYWAEGRDLEDPAVVAAALSAAGLDGPALVAAAPDHKDALRARTDEAVSIGVFGAPTFVVGDHLFWGQDRMHFVERALRGWEPPAPGRVP